MKTPIKWVWLLFVLILLLYIVGLVFDLFYITPWYDIPMHLLGGFWVGLIFAVSLGYFFDNDNIFQNHVERLKVITLIAAFSCLVGVFWEFFEFGLNYLSLISQQQGLADTLGDLFMDIIGGAAAGFLLLFARKDK